MRSFLKKHYKKIIILASDVALALVAVACKHLSGFMLSFDAPCLLSLIGMKCVSCGGTHFVRDLLSGDVWQAFLDNQFFFICGVFLLLSLVVLHLFMLFDLKIAKRILLRMYSIPTLICFAVGMFAFLILRNIPFFMELGRLAAQAIQRTK